jgi:hypothetical protein
MNQFQQFDDEKLQLFSDVQARMDVESLLSILPKGMDIPQDIFEKTNTCWTNVLLILARLFGRKISRSVALQVFSRIRAANSTMKSPTQMPELVDALNLPIILVEYSLNLATGKGVGWSFGPTNGKREIFLCNIGAHYQIFVRPGTTMANLGMLAPPASYKLFPDSRKIIEGITLSKRDLAEVNAINDACTPNSTCDVIAQQELADAAMARQLAARKQQELADAAMARQLADRKQQELADAVMARRLAARKQQELADRKQQELADRKQQELADAVMARRLAARKQQELADRKQQELADAAMARRLAGLHLQPTPQSKPNNRLVDAIVSQQRAIDLAYARQLAARNQQELADAAMARRLAGLPPKPR